MIKRLTSLFRNTPSIPSDHNVELLRGAVGGWMEMGNLASFDYAAEHMPEGAVIEIGSFTGLSTIVIAQKFKGKKIYNCDGWKYDGGDCYHVKSDDYMNLVFERYKRNAQDFAPSLPSTIRAFSDEFFELWGKNENVVDVFDRPITLGGSIGFAYIDGDHSYDGAKRDFVNVDRHLSPSGLILFDDSSIHAPGGVHRVMLEIESYGYSVVMKNPNYLVRKK